MSLQWLSNALVFLSKSTLRSSCRWRRWEPGKRAEFFYVGHLASGNVHHVPAGAVANSRSAFVDVSGRSSFGKGDYRSIRGYTISVAAYGRTSMRASCTYQAQTRNAFSQSGPGNREQIAPEHNVGEISPRNFSRYERRALRVRSTLRFTSFPRSI